MWVHPKLHGYTFIYPQLQGSPPPTISRVYFYIPVITRIVPYSITGILLYTRNYRGVPPTISRVYFYVPTTTGEYPHNITGILLYTHKQSVCMRLPRRTMSSSQWRKVLHYNVIPSEAWESPNPPHLSHIVTRCHTTPTLVTLWHLWQALHHNVLLFHVSLFHFPMFWNNETRNLGI